MERLRDQNQGLPKSKQNLTRAISKMCYISSSVNCTSVFKRLEANKFIHLSKDEVIIHVDNLQSADIEHKYNSYEENKTLANGGYQYYSSSFEILPLVPSKNKQQIMAVDRAVCWLKSLNCEKMKRTSFNSQLEQLCLFKVYLSANNVVDILEKAKLLQVGDDYESITYTI